MTVPEPQLVESSDRWRWLNLLRFLLREITSFRLTELLRNSSPNRAGRSFRLDEGWLIQRNPLKYGSEFVMCTSVLCSWLKSRCSRVTTSSSGAYKALGSFNQLYHQELLYIFNPNLPYEMGMVFMETFFSQQIHLTLPKFPTLFLRLPFLFFFHIFMLISLTSKS